jgi:RND family efflux transporter MFP subunit
MATRSSRWLWRIVVLLILAAGIGGFAALNILQPEPAVRAPAERLPLVQVEALELREGALRVTGHGLVKPRAEAVLGVEVPGRIAFVSPSLAAGGTFAQGEVLLRLDDAPYRAAFAQAEAELVSARAGLRLAEQQLERTRDLIAQGFQSRQALDERSAARDQAAAALARAQALVQQRRLDLERSVVSAPFDGKVLSARVDRGESVQPGRELARVYADRPLEVAVSLTDREMALVANPWRAGNGSERGAAASVEVEHGGGLYRWPARVHRVESSVDAATRTFNVVVRVERPAERGHAVRGEAAAAPPLLVGMYATVHIEGIDPGRHALVPRRALHDGDVLWLLGPAGTLQVRPVRVLQATGERVVVSAEGLPVDARVVTSDLKVVTDGMRVREIDGAQGRPSP